MGVCLLAAACLLTAGCGGDADAGATRVAPKQTAKSSQAAPSAKTPVRFTALQTSAEEDGPTGNWGTLRGTFVYGDDRPTPEKIIPTKDVDYCGQHTLVDQSLVVNEDGQIANVFVSIYVPRTGKLDVHESYDESADGEVVLDNTQCRFEPHCLIVRTSQKLVIKNSDPMGHNTNLQTEGFNQLIEPNGSISHGFQVARINPVPVACNIHPWMNGHLLIRNDPYAAVSADDGSFEIKNIPAGTHEFILWHERPGYLGNLTAGKVKTDRRGRMKIEIPPGKIVDLGEIKIPADALRDKY